MNQESKILSQIERKRVALNLRVLPETVATLHQYVQYLSERAAAQGLNESQLNVSLLLDHFAAELRAAEGFAAWTAKHGATRRRSKATEPTLGEEGRSAVAPVGSPMAGSPQGEL